MLITERYGMNIEEVTEMLDMYRHLRASFEGHAGEYAFVKHYVKPCARITGHRKPDPQNKKEKGDLVVTFEDTPVSIELKSALTGFRVNPYKNPVQVQTVHGPVWKFLFKTRTSSYKTIKYSDGTELSTLNVPYGQVDVYGVCVRPFTGVWEYMYCLTSDLPHNANPNLTPVQQRETLSPVIRVEWPPEAPWTNSLETILERAVAQKKNSSAN
jgi:hypothetical protein